MLQDLQWNLHAVKGLWEIRHGVGCGHDRLELGDVEHRVYGRCLR